MKTKHPIQSKTILGVLVAALGALFTQFGMPVVEGDVESISSALLQIAGLAFAIYGRYKAQTRIQAPDKSVVPLLLLPLLVVSLALQPGCKGLEHTFSNLPPAVSKTAKFAVNLAVNYGLSKAAGSVRELQPLLPLLVQETNSIFAQESDAQRIAERLRAMAIRRGADAAQRGLIELAIREGLEMPPEEAGLTGAGVEEMDLREAILAAL